jgi:hypothetical protein
MRRLSPEAIMGAANYSASFRPEAADAAMMTGA